MGRRRFLRVVWLAAILACAATWQGRVSQQLDREREAAAALKQLGVLLAMDQTQRHVASANFATIPPTQLHGAVPQAAAMLPRLVRLSGLDASHTPLGDAELAYVAELRQLRSLTLSHTGVTDAGLGRLHGLQRVAALYLAGNQVTNAGLPSLSRLPALKVLDLSHTQVSGGLQHLASLPSLEWLLLDGLDLAHADLAELAGAGSLHRLHLEGSTYDAESLNRLSALRPEVRIFR
jgi:Leucine-rich repeat (LRR) protein